MVVVEHPQEVGADAQQLSKQVFFLGNKCYSKAMGPNFLQVDEIFFLILVFFFFIVVVG